MPNYRKKNLSDSNSAAHNIVLCCNNCPRLFTGGCLRVYLFFEKILINIIEEDVERGWHSSLTELGARWCFSIRSNVIFDVFLNFTSRPVSPSYLKGRARILMSSRLFEKVSLSEFMIRGTVWLFSRVGALNLEDKRQEEIYFHNSWRDKRFIMPTLLEERLKKQYTEIYRNMYIYQQSSIAY